MLQHLQEAGLRQTMTRLVRPMLSPSIPVSLQRTLIAQAYRSSVPPKATRFSSDSLSGVPVTRCQNGKSTRGVILYLHGGGYIIGSSTTHRGLTGHLAKASGCEIITPDYRLAPEHPFPAALEDAEAVYCALLAEGHSPKHIAVAGDSAGGGLTIALAMKLRDSGQELPSSLTVFSPWVDLTQSNLYKPEREPVLQAKWTEKAARLYAADNALTTPYISPVYGDLAKLPPLLIQVGSEEILLNDAERLAQTANRDDVDVRLEVYNSLWHVFQVHAGQLERSTSALEAAGTHIKSRLAD